MGMARYFMDAKNPASDLDTAYALVLLGEQSYKEMDKKKQQRIGRQLGKDKPIRVRREIERVWFKEVMARRNPDELNTFLNIAQGALPVQREAVKALLERLDYEKQADYVREHAPSDEAFFALQKMVSKDFSSGNWLVVRDTLARYESLFAQKNEAFQDLYDRVSQTKRLKKMVPIPWEGGKQYSGYSPVFSGDGKQLYFCNRLGISEDIYYSQYSEKGWSTPIPVAGINTTARNESAQHISPNGTEMLVFVSGDIYESKKTANGWQTSQPLPDHINTGDWDGDSRYFSGGLIFVSKKEGNFDIYISQYGPDGHTLQPPFAIGDVINTKGTERKPFLHPDQKTLYFASDSHDGFGGFDVFVSTRLDDTWRNWSKPRNLGLSINSSADEWDFLVSTDGSRGYSVFGTGGSYAITSIDLPTAYRPQTVHTFETRVLGTDGKPIDGEVVIRDVESGNIVQIVRPDPLT